MPVKASCGCWLKEGDEGVPIRYGSSDCDAVDGFCPCVVYALFCSECAARARQWPEYLPDTVDDDWWFNVGYARWKDEGQKV